MFSRRLFLYIALMTAAWLAMIPVNQIQADIVTVLFNGFNPGDPSGMDEFKVTLDANFAADFPLLTHSSQVFEYHERGQAFNFVNGHSEVDQLFLVGFSWGGNAMIRLAQEWLLPAGIMVNASFQIDSVDLFDGGLGDDVLPSNVINGYNFFQIPTGFLEPGGEQNVVGALNVNAEVFFNDPSITHTSMDDDSRIHDLYYARMRTIVTNAYSPINPQSVPEPLAGVWLITGLGLCRRPRRLT